MAAFARTDTVCDCFRPGSLQALTASSISGFFVDTLELRHDTELNEASEASVIESLFEVAMAEENQPCIMFIREAEKTIFASYERYTQFKKHLEKIANRTVVIGATVDPGSHCESDRIIGASVVSDGTRRDKGLPQSLVVKGGGGHTTTLVDFSFFDHMSRVEERAAKETSKVAKYLSKLLPTRVSVLAPTETAEVRALVARSGNLAASF